MNNLEYMEALKEPKKYHKDAEGLNKYQDQINNQKFKRPISKQYYNCGTS